MEKEINEFKTFDNVHEMNIFLRTHNITILFFLSDVVDKKIVYTIGYKVPVETEGYNNTPEVGGGFQFGEG